MMEPDQRPRADCRAWDTVMNSRVASDMPEPYITPVNSKKVKRHRIIIIISIVNDNQKFGAGRLLELAEFR